MDNKKKVTTGLIVASMASLNTHQVKSLLKEEFLLETSNIQSEEPKNSIEKFNNNLEKSNNKDLIEDMTNNNVTYDISKIEDKALIEAVSQAINKNEKNITEKDFLSIKELDISGKGIKDLSGIENFTNLEYLNMSNNKISDIDVLNKLPNLKKIIASNNNITDVTCLSDNKLIEGDFRNQNIILEDVNLLEDNFNLKNPIISSKDIKVDFSIPNGGSLKNNSFEWDNLDFENNLIKIPFESINDNISFSGVLKQRVSIDSSIFEDIEITITPTNINWTNTDFNAQYFISDKYKPLIDKIELPDGSNTVSLTGAFNISDNGIYTIKVYLKNSTFIEKKLEVSNIDKNKPNLNLVDKSINKGISTLKLEANDLESGISYILLPNGKKIYKNNAVYSSEINSDIKFKVFDKAGNYEELIIYPENIKTENIEKNSPKIFATSRVMYIGDKFNALSEVKAVDFKGNDISNNISIIFNNVDTSSLGEYTVSYKVVDSNGHQTIKDIIIEVIDKPKNINTKNPINTSSSKEIKNSLQYQQTPIEYQQTPTLEHTSKTIEVSSSDISNLNNNLYSTGILFSMVAGFRFLFKSGKDDF